jgi:hypothetical protein
MKKKMIRQNLADQEEKKHFHELAESLLAEGRQLRDFLNKKIETDSRYELLWEAFVEEGGEFRDLLEAKVHGKGWTRKMAEQYKVYSKLCKIGKKALAVLERADLAKERTDQRWFMHEMLKRRFEKGEKQLESLLYEGASGESASDEEGHEKLHKRVWLGKLGRALDEQEQATKAIENYLSQTSKKKVILILASLI